MRITGIVLAAGLGKRMKSKLHKVLHPLCGKPVVGHVIDTLRQVTVDPPVVVIGHGAQEVKEYIGDRAVYVVQEQQLGTGHAVRQAQPILEGQDGITIVIFGDTPLVTVNTLQRLVALHQERGAAATLLTARLEQPAGYGRVVRDEQGQVIRIVEQKDCTPEQAAIQEINAGTCCFDNRKLFQALRQVNNRNQQQEYYLTDVIAILAGQGDKVEGYCTDDVDEALGINDRAALAQAAACMRRRINHRHLLNGVTMLDPQSTYIDADVNIGEDTVLYPGTILAGQTEIGAGCTIGPNSEITDSQIGESVTVKQSVVHRAIVGNGSTVGPFAYLRPGTKLGKRVKIGDFVEIKNAEIAEDSKVSHLSYIGDATVGSHVNFGCGAITVNYDGYSKHRTEIGDEAFIGSNVNLIAPVQIGKGAYVVAGSTITDSVADNDFAIARERQLNKPGYAEKLRDRIRSSQKTE